MCVIKTKYLLCSIEILKMMSKISIVPNRHLDITIFLKNPVNNVEIAICDEKNQAVFVKKLCFSLKICSWHF